MSSNHDTHPLVATPTTIKKMGVFPGPAGQRRPTGVFPKRASDTMIAVAEALFSADDHPCPEDRLQFLRRELNDLMARASPRGRLMFRLGTFAVSVISPLLIGRLPPFRRLPLNVRRAALQKMEARPIGAALIAVRAVLCLLYYEHPDAAAEIGIQLGPTGRLL